MMFERVCEVCGADFQAVRANARYCKPAHRTKASRERIRAAAQAAAERENADTSDTARERESMPLTEATRAELREVGLDESAAGVAVLGLARRVDTGNLEPGTSYASLVRTWRIQMDAIMTRARPVVEDQVAKARAKRDERRAAR